MITSPDNQQLKLIRKLQRKKERDASGLFVAEGEDLIEAARRPAGSPRCCCAPARTSSRSCSTGSARSARAARVIGVYRAALVGAGRRLSASTCTAWATRATSARSSASAHALCDGPVILGPGCADPFGPKAVRASMGSIFARPPARAALERAAAARCSRSTPRGASGAARRASTRRAAGRAVRRRRARRAAGRAAGSGRRGARIPLRDDGPDSLNAAMAATVGLYELGNRMAADG